VNEGSGLWPQRCKVCGKRDKLDFTVSDEIWKAIVPEPYQKDIVCLACFDALASQRGVDYADAIEKEIYFCGDKASFIMRIVIRKEAPRW
jgi:hypothetical protein